MIMSYCIFCRSTCILIYIFGYMYAQNFFLFEMSDQASKIVGIVDDLGGGTRITVGGRIAKT